MKKLLVSIIALACALVGSAADAESAATGFRKLGAMIDVSRGRVFTVPYLKGCFERMAKMGYNGVMLYTEETYKLEGVPKWGYMRGGYTLDDIKELKACADANGLELVPCIETLGHLEKYLRWADADDVRCSDSTLLVGEPKTYELIEKMISFWQEAVGGTRIHVGMDEAWGFGGGEYQKRNGKRPKFDIFLEHLQKVCEICKCHGFTEIMVWSDMFYRMGSPKSTYYDINATPSPELAAKIPPGVRLVYWDYYHDDANFYEKMIDGHVALGGKPILAGGIQVWDHFLHHRTKTLSTTKAFLKAAKTKGCDEMWFTIWGDNGAYYIPESMEEGLFACAELAAGRPAEPNDDNCARFRALIGMDYRALAKIDESVEFPVKSVQGCEAAYFYDDPLYMVALRNAMTQWGGNAGKRFAAWRAALAEADVGAAASGAPVASAFNRALLKRLDWSVAIMEAWKSKDAAKIRAAAKKLDEAAAAMREFCALYRDNWNATSRPFGFELIQKRNAGVLARFGEAKRRVHDYLDGKVETIPELDEAIEPFGQPASKRTISW